ncbi:MAG: hypothetical protein ACTTKI_03805 [Tannerella sp.]|uniref:hypothetical protein n=1 Tax=Tannerella sp. TaxID=2382127 RepID=UPI003FA264D3
MGASELPVEWFFITRRVAPNISTSDSRILTDDIGTTSGTYPNHPTPASEHIHGWLRTVLNTPPNYI